MSDVVGGPVEYQSGGARIKAYSARPEGEGRFPAVIVVHEIWGVSPHIEDVARRFAREGYVALAPDLYSRGGMPVTPEQIGEAMGVLQTLPPEARANPGLMQAKLEELPDGKAVAETMKWLQSQDRRQRVADLQAAVSWLADQPFARPERIGAMGFCMGGGLAGLLAASGAPLAACVIFYGENPQLDQVANIRCPVLGLYGGNDHRITDTVPALAEAMQRAGKSFEYHIYPGASHAFFNDTRNTYNPDAAADAWRRMLEFLQRTLKTGETK